jgi:prepilin-type N-terminal cleavage/methylation domain-containing protein
MRAKGFTLLEVMVVVAIAAIVAAIAVPTLRSARRNANVSSIAFELVVWLEGLRSRAIRDQDDLVALVVDVPDNDPIPCARGRDARCGAYYLIRPAGPTFALANFDPANITTHSYLWDRQLPRGVRFHRHADGVASPPPYSAIRVFDPLLVGACAGGRSCVGIRFRANGDVEPIWPTGVPGASRPGLAFALGSELSPEASGAPGPMSHAASHQQAIAITFPAGIVKTYGVAP